MAKVKAGSQLEHVLRDMGGSASLRRLASVSRLPYPTVRDAADRLVRDGVLVRTSGLYSLAKSPLADEETRRLLELIVESGLDAHLTGLDLLGHWWQQFAYQTPHLVYVDPPNADTLTQTLTSKGFVVVPLDRSRGGVTTEAPPSTGVVFLRTQAAEFAARFGVVAGKASIEKAWLDAVREARRNVIPLSLYDLGQILGAALADHAIDEQRLKSLARRAKLPVVVDALDGNSRNADARQLLAGLTSETSGRVG